MNRTSKHFLSLLGGLSFVKAAVGLAFKREVERVRPLRMSHPLCEFYKVAAGWACLPFTVAKLSFDLCHIFLQALEHKWKPNELDHIFPDAFEESKKSIWMGRECRCHENF